jgi:hypothetical protein
MQKAILHAALCVCIWLVSAQPVFAQCGNVESGNFTGRTLYTSLNTSGMAV